MPPEEEANRDPLGASSFEEEVHNAKRYNTMTAIDPYEHLERRSIYRRKSFLMEFVDKKGPPQILILCVLLALGFGSTVGVVPAVMSDRYARLNHGYDDPTECAKWSIEDKPHECLLGSADAQNAAAYESLVSNMFTFITSSMIGSISDEIGRKGIIVVGLLLSCLQIFCLVLIQIRPFMSPTWYYVVGGASGLISWMAVCLSALSDVLPPQWRAAGFGLLIAGFSLGFALSPILATLLNHLQVSITALSVLSIAWLTTIFFFPETLPPEVAAEAARVRRARPQSPTVWGRVLQALGRPFRELSILNRSSFFRILSALAFFSGMVSAGDQRLLIYYVEERLGFTDKDVALMFVLIGIPGIIVQGILIKPFIECLGEKHVIALCFMVGALDNVMYGLAGQKVTIFVAITISSFCGMAFPTISAVKSNNVEESEQGRIQGALYSLQALASGVGPMLLRLVYHFTKDSRFPGAGTMFIFAGSLYIVAAGFAMALPREKADSRIRNKESDTMKSPAEGPETSLL